MGAHRHSVRVGYSISADVRMTVLADWSPINLPPTLTFLLIGSLLAGMGAWVIYQSFKNQP